METAVAAGADENSFRDVCLRPKSRSRRDAENLSEAEQKRYIYERTYGESLPEDFPV